jgi:hypothetical protein
VVCLGGAVAVGSVVVLPGGVHTTNTAASKDAGRFGGAANVI